MANDGRLNEIERLLVAAAEDPAQRADFSSALLAAEVYVLGSVDRPAAEVAGGSDSSMKLVTLTDEEGPITPFFTSEAALERALAARPDTDPRFVRLNTRDLFSMMNGKRLVLNPDGPGGKIYLPGEVERLLLDGDAPGEAQVLPAGSQIFVGEPANVSAELPGILARFFDQQPAVDAAHLGWFVRPDGQKGYLLAIVTTDPESAMDGFGTLPVPEHIGEETFDVMFAAPGEEHLLTSVPAFYTREEQEEVPAPKGRGLFGRRK